MRYRITTDELDEFQAADCLRALTKYGALSANLTIWGDKEGHEFEANWTAEIESIEETVALTDTRGRK